MTGRGYPRILGAFVSVALVLSAFALVAPSPAHASPNSMRFADGSSKKSFGPNGMIFIDGSLEYDDQCRGGGIPDFAWAATDVYIIPTGGSGGRLRDAGGANPNTIVAASSHIFIDEMIGITSPGGTLGAGVYDIVFDTCQDGFLSHNDSIFFEAITVVLPETLPPADASIARIKDKARQQYASWLEAHLMMTAIFKVDDAAAILQCILAPSLGCLAEALAVIYDRDAPMGQIGDTIEGRVLGLMANVAANYGAIWQDPPDRDFAQVTPLAAVDHEVPGSAGAVPDALVGMIGPLGDEAALSKALLHSVERYQGAQAAGDGEWALVHARAVRDLSSTLSSHLAGTGAVGDFRGAVVARAPQLDAQFAAGAAFAGRVRAKGFTPDERRVLANLGKDANAIAAVESALALRAPAPAPTTANLVAKLDGVLAARSESVTALNATAAAWDEVVAALEARTTIRKSAPTADAGGPYTGPSVSLDGRGSSTPPGTSITAYEWDLDGDGQFDDATGPTPPAAFPVDGNRLVGLRVTNDAGRTAIDYATVRTTGGNRAPQISASTPATASSVLVGQSASFSVTAADPAGGPLGYAWTVDGRPAGGGGPAFTYNPAAGDVGAHTVTVTVTGQAGRTAVRAWRVSVTTVDGDGDGWTSTSDCDDTRADVHPGAIERLGNDLDDDCNPSTPDAPPGGLTGTPWTWGHETGAGHGTYQNVLAPAALANPAAVVQLESMINAGYAVLADGQVRSWGGSGIYLGWNDSRQSRTPVSPVGVGGTGTLSGVTQLQADGGAVAARRSDGSVVTWGYNINGQGGDGSTVQYRLYPVEVVNQDGSLLTGVKQVEFGENSVYGLMDDGTIRSWAYQRCTGTAEPHTLRKAAPAPLFGGGNVQIEAAQTWVVTRKADGSVWTCGTDLHYLARGSKYPPMVEMRTPRQVPAFGPNSGVIDVTAGMSSGFALKEDGSLWAWGKNLNHELDIIGLAPKAVAWEPVQVPLPPGPPIVDIDIDDSCHGLAVRADGSVLSWGCNLFGGAGINSQATAVPGMQVINLPGTAVSASVAVWNGMAVARPLSDPAWERPAQWIKAGVADAQIGESSGGEFIVTLSDPARDQLTVSWELSDGSSGTATVPAGASSVAIPVSVVDDAIDEDDELVTFRITSISHGVRIERGTAIGTVIDDDDPPVASVEPVTVVEGDTSLSDAVLTVRLSAPSAKTVTVAYATTDGTATAPGDYGSTQGALVIPRGATEGAIHLPVRGDTVVEPEEWFSVSLTSAENATIGTAAATVTIVDDEVLVVDVASPRVTEGNSGTIPAVFTLTLNPAPPPGIEVTVPYSVRGLTATVGEDLVATSGTARFGPAEASVQVTVEVRGDTTPEPDETFRLVLGAPSSSDGRTVLPGDTTVAVIVDDDPRNRPPECAPVTASPGILWPVNHKMVTVSLSGATDPDGDDRQGHGPAIRVTGVTQDEPVNGPGDGNTAPDARLLFAAHQVELRAERSGTGDGRVYRVAFTATDPAGATCSGVVIVGVPHNQKFPAVDSGVSFDSLVSG